MNTDFEMVQILENILPEYFYCIITVQQLSKILPLLYPSALRYTNVRLFVLCVDYFSLQNPTQEIG